MLFQLDTKSTDPMYEQLEEQVARYVYLGVLMPEEKLPSVRSLAGELGINPNTVAKAYKLLEAEEIIYTVAAKGVYIGKKENAERFIKKRTLNHFESIVKKAKLSGVSASELEALISAVYKGGKSLD